jgi:hypothetical protein
MGHSNIQIEGLRLESLGAIAIKPQTNLVVSKPATKPMIILPDLGLDDPQVLEPMEKPNNAPKQKLKVVSTKPILKVDDPKNDRVLPPPPRTPKSKVIVDLPSKIKQAEKEAALKKSPFLQIKGEKQLYEVKGKKLVKIKDVKQMNYRMKLAFGTNWKEELLPLFPGRKGWVVRSISNVNFDSLKKKLAGKPAPAPKKDAPKATTPKLVTKKGNQTKAEPTEPQSTKNKVPKLNPDDYKEPQKATTSNTGKVAVAASVVSIAVSAFKAFT